MLYLLFLIAKKQADAVAMVASVMIEGIINFFILSPLSSLDSLIQQRGFCALLTQWFKFYCNKMTLR